MRLLAFLISQLSLCLVGFAVFAAGAERASAQTMPGDEQMPSTAASTQPAPATQPLHVQAQQAIDRGVEYLLGNQNKDGSWSGRSPAQAPGMTALAGLSLLSAGQSHQSAAMVATIKYLKKARIEPRYQTYSLGLRAAFYSQLPEPLRRAELPQDLRMLIRNAQESGVAQGLYSYWHHAGPTDYSNSQYGVLGVWYATLAGLEVPTSYWRSVEAGWRAGQQRDGGWGYRIGDADTTGSMTAAGVATLFITNDYLHAAQEQDLLRPYVNAPLHGGVDWLGAHFAVDHNPVHDSINDRDEDPPVDFDGEIRSPWVHYMLFGYERAGEASGLTRFGTHKWFDEGAQYLISTQSEDGSWEGTVGRIPSTAYALLFLSRGRSPVAIQKLAYNGRWNNRSRDAATLVRWLTRQTERHTNWQIVSPDATPEELREAPILYLAGDGAVTLSAEQRQRIKNYIDQGGMLLAANEGPNAHFAIQIIELARQLYPAYTFRELPADHPIFNENFPVKDLDVKPSGLSNGVRELIVLLPGGDFSWKWQAGAGSADPAKAPAFGLIGNLWLYVTDKANPRYKGEDTWVDRAEIAAPIPPSFSIARIRFNGNWDPEPAGWLRLTNLLHNAGQLELHVNVIDPTTLSWPRYPLAHLTSTDNINLTPPQTAALKKYLDAGGLLMFDAAGGSAAAQLQFEALIDSLYPGTKLTPLPDDHPIYTGVGFGGEKIDTVTWRRFALPRVPRSSRPQLLAASVNGRIIAMASPQDISAGLVGYNIDGIVGYSPPSALELMRNVLLWRAAGSAR